MDPIQKGELGGRQSTVSKLEQFGQKRSIFYMDIIRDAVCEYSQVQMQMHMHLLSVRLCG